MPIIVSIIFILISYSQLPGLIEKKNSYLHEIGSLTLIHTIILIPALIFIAGSVISVKQKKSPITNKQIYCIIMLFLSYIPLFGLAKWG